MRKLALLSAAILAAAPSAAFAQLRGTDIPWDFSAPLVGSRTEGIGFVSGGNYATDGLTFNIGWDISYDAGTSLFSYVYTLSGVGGRINNSVPNGPGISHFILGLSQACESDVSVCVSDAETSFNGGAPKQLTPLADDYSGAQPSNPGLGISVFGAKFDNSFAQTGLTGVITISFLSEHRPMWGDFYIKGGESSFLVNNAASSVALSTSNLAGDYVAVPDTFGASVSSVPEPSSYALMASGLIGMAGVAVRRRKR